MGTYLNPDNQNFLEMVNTGRYVDKTMLISQANKQLGDPTFKFICVSRPRRFGKTIAGNMLSAYYSKGADSRKLFEPFKISQDPSFETHLNKYNVLKLDINAMYSEWLCFEPKEKRPNTVIAYFTRLVCEEFKKEFSDVDFGDDGTISGFIQKIYMQKKQTFIIILDEYDVFIREKDLESQLPVYLGFLNSLFKNTELVPAISLAYITGILPIMKDKIQSKLNTFRQYTMLEPSSFSEYVGFLPEEVAAICKKYGCSFEDCKNWYDGYRLEGFEVYNPESVMIAAITGKFKSYWSGTSTYNVIKEKIQMNFAGTKEAVIAMIGGETIDVSVGKYDNTMTGLKSKDDVFTFLIHLGYLAYDEEERVCYIPNREIHDEWIKAISDDSNYEQTNKIIEDSKNLLAQTLAGNEELVAQALDRSHDHVSSNRSYNNEYSLQSAIYLAYIYALNGYTIVKEMPAGKGIADIVYIPLSSNKNQTAIIVELKHNQSAESALTQIKQKRYFDCLSAWHGKLLFVGVNYNEKTKKHECKIERFVK